MNKRLSTQWQMVVGVLIIGSSLWLTGCAPQSAIARSPLPTPQVGENSPSDLARSYLITPLPGEKVRVGEITEVVETTPITTPIPSRYAVRKDIPPWRPHTKPGESIEVEKLFVSDSTTGQEIRLGDDHGHATLETLTDQYVIWRFRRNDGRREAVSLKSGLYAHVLETGQEIVIAQEPNIPENVKLASPWVAYLDVSGPNIYFAQLRAHHLITGEDFLIGKEVPYNRPGGYYAISGDRIVWVEVETRTTDAQWLIRMYDLTTRTASTLNVPKVVAPVDLSLSGDIVVWLDAGTKGYDLKQDALFTIPLIPPGWENLRVQPIGPVTVRDDQLYWSLSVNKQIHPVTAPIIRDK